MPSKLKKVPKIHASDDAEVREIHARYFLSIGLACESPAPGTPEWKAAFQIKFGRPVYRRLAWEDVREDVKAQVPAWVYTAMNEYFTNGPALHFTAGFSLEDRERMRTAIQKGGPQRRKNEH